MRLEAAVLALMIAPVAIGAAALVSPPLAATGPLPVLDLPDMSWEPGAVVELGGGNVSAAPSPAPSWPMLSLVIAAIYLAGLAVSSLRLVRARLRLGRIVRAGIAAPALGDCVRLTNEALSPFASPCGAIVLPHRLAEALPAAELALIVGHERAHIERGDARTYWALASVDALFWFNPFVRRQTARCRFAAELACDAAVVAAAPEGRSAYAGALVAAMKHAAGAPLEAPLGAPGVFSTRGKGEHKTRLTRIMGAEPAPRSRLARLAVASASVLVVPLGALQLAACAGGRTPDAADAAQAGEQSGVALDTGLEIRTTDVDRVTVERIDAENLIRLTGPLAIHASNGMGATEQIDLHLAPAGEFTEPRIASIASPRVVFAAPLAEGPTVRALANPPARVLEMTDARFTACGRTISLPKLGEMRTVPCPDADLEIVADDEASIRVERRTDGLTRLHGPLRIRMSYGAEFETDSVEVHYAPVQDTTAAPQLVQRITAAVTIADSSGTRTEAANFTVCGRVLTLPQLGQVEGEPCQTALDTQSLTFVNPEDWAGAPFTAIPLDGRLSSDFGRRTDPITGDEANHTGIDIAAPEGTPVVAAADGEAIFVGWRGGYGRVVELDHGGGFKTRSSQMSAFDVAQGDRVSAGQVIGRVGASGRATGTHMHWELWYEGRVYDPMPMLAELGFDGEG